MSEFDKEAEREKLRAKYEDEEQDRESTERMSDLLLKGATMTNAHCGTCGDPIFRHEGQEFCPTCQEVLTDEGAQADADAADADEADGPETEGDGQPDPDVPAEAASDENTTGATDADLGNQSSPDAPGQSTTPDQPGTSSETAHVRGETAQGAPTTTAPSASGSEAVSGGQSSSPDPTGESLASARASLERTVTRLAQQAEASDDLERARAYLAATEEAADALAAVKRADR
ncbi:Sjogren's syndrome/scleroderma autoantigen 1 family protein [Halorientalis salina]|uniref:Sjogren's syndrome/scleroderma autoantigen 1 family protein n=1 Tax=Halorientalis salina TaxID=2932266 RepID=UPI0010AC61CE|nr:Sjogren's syndrome/scleroderma autoantigen 1 family protein [Halorientalis salina]